MEKITEKEAMKLLKEFDVEEMTKINTEDYDWVKDRYPKAWELIQKLDDTVMYVNVDDLQSGSWAVGLYGTARAWALHICQWADSDEYEDDYEDGDLRASFPSSVIAELEESAEDADDWGTTYLCPLLDYFKTEEDTLDLINEIWSIDIRELCYEGGDNMEGNKRLNVVLYNESGSEIAREVVTETKTIADIVSGWIIYAGDAIKFEEEDE